MFAGATVHSELGRPQILNLIDSLQPDLLVHHEPSDKNGINSKCPQVWILHCTNSLRKLPPKHASAAMVFSNFDSHEIHSSWRQLSLKVLPLQIDTRSFDQPNGSTLAWSAASSAVSMRIRFHVLSSKRF